MKDTQSTFINKANFAILLLVFVSFLAYWHMQKAYVKLRIQSTVRTEFKIYWADENEQYSEKRAVAIPIRNSKREYTFFLTHLRHVQKLRIDPCDRAGKVVINNLIIRQEGYEPIRFSPASDLEPAGDVERLDRQKDGIAVYSSGIDPQLEMVVTPKRLAIRYDVEAMRLICMAALGILLFRLATRLQSNHTYITYLMTFAAALMLTMAGLSKYNKHPDEYVHVSAAAYYQDHWLPPEICDPETESTYSVYGVSRLNSHEIVYFLAGKFSSLLTFLPMQNHVRLRLFNVGLFIILLLMSLKNVEFRFVSMVLLLSPQVWYIFSYFNSDAFALFMALTACYQILIKDSCLNCFLTNTEKTNILPSGIVLGILFSFLLMAKKNFFIFILFMALYYSVTLYRGGFENPLITVKRMGVILGIAVSIFSLSWAASIAVNGFNAEKKETACREKLARRAYKPSTPLAQKMPGIRLRERGVSLHDVIVKHRWGEKVFRSAFGVYGYTSISGSKKYYHFPRILGTLFLLVVVFFSFYKSSPQARFTIFYTVLCCGLLICAALWKSWTSDFQAQGRYLLPIVPIFGFQLFQIRENINRPALHILTLAMFAVSLYSFVFIGLVEIPK